MNISTFVAHNNEFTAVSRVYAVWELQQSLAALQRDVQGTRNNREKDIRFYNDQLEPLRARLAGILKFIEEIGTRKIALPRCVLRIDRGTSGVPRIETITDEARQALEASLEEENTRLQSQKSELSSAIERLQQELSALFGNSLEEIQFAEAQLEVLQPQLTFDERQELLNRKVEQQLLQEYDRLYSQRIENCRSALNSWDERSCRDQHNSFLEEIEMLSLTERINRIRSEIRNY